MADQSMQDIFPDNDQTRARLEHLGALHPLVGNAYPNRFGRSQVAEAGHEDTITAILDKFRGFEPKVIAGSRPAAEELELANQQLNKISVRLAGRIASPPRVMGKAAFVHLSDGTSRLQTYLRKSDVKAINNDTGALVGDEGAGWELFGILDHGDFIGVEGFLFVTKTGELSVHVQSLQFLAKALLPLPDKMHGLNDPELRQRQRYADLIAGSLKIDLKSDEEEEAKEARKEHGDSVPQVAAEKLTTRQVFERRAVIVREFRRILDDHGYIEVETPMLTPLPTGAAARPFKTHHTALGIDLYARIAPELYLKRLLVGGFERVYELNRCFRNEGISTRHNPEFTMLEFYWAYADVNQMMDFCESIMRAVVYKALGHTHAQYGSLNIDFSQAFARLTMKDAIAKYWPAEWRELGGETFAGSWLDDNRTLSRLDRFAASSPIPVSGTPGQGDAAEVSLPSSEAAVRRKEELWEAAQDAPIVEAVEFSLDARAVALKIERLFVAIAEHRLQTPTFIHDYPKSISPLSKASPRDAAVAERFELFIAGMECANGFSELNDPAEQYQRFKDQVQQREGGDDEAMVMDEDYIRALSYGMPPAAGIGIGIDRFVMLLANRQSIRDVILFPHMRPERSAPDPKTEE